MEAYFRTHMHMHQHAECTQFIALPAYIYLPVLQEEWWERRKALMAAAEGGGEPSETDTAGGSNSSGTNSQNGRADSHSNSSSSNGRGSGLGSADINNQIVCLWNEHSSSGIGCYHGTHVEGWDAEALGSYGMLVQDDPGRCQAPASSSLPTISSNSSGSGGSHRSQWGGFFQSDSEDRAVAAAGGGAVPGYESVITDDLDDLGASTSSGLQQDAPDGWHDPLEGRAVRQHAVLQASNYALNGSPDDRAPKGPDLGVAGWQARALEGAKAKAAAQDVDSPFHMVPVVSS